MLYIDVTCLARKKRRSSTNNRLENVFLRTQNKKKTPRKTKVFWDRVSLCSPGCPGTHSVDQAGLKLRNPPASASQVLRLKAWAIMPGSWYIFKRSKCQVKQGETTKVRLRSLRAGLLLPGKCPLLWIPQCLGNLGLFWLPDSKSHDLSSWGKNQKSTLGFSHTSDCNFSRHT